MVEEDLCGRDISDERVIEAMKRVDRTPFVPEWLVSEAYEDQVLPLTDRVAVATPYTVAMLTQFARVRSGFSVLEVGTGSGYHAAVLAEMGASVTTIERDQHLYDSARKALFQAGYTGVACVLGDGMHGVVSGAPYDVVILTGAVPEVPGTLLSQLEDEGRLVAPVGTAHQVLTVITRDQDQFERRRIAPVSFQPILCS